MSRKKTIAIVVNTSWNIYNFRMNLVNALVNAGYEVLCIAPHDEYSEKLVTKHVRYEELKMENRGVNPFQDLLLCWTLYRLYRKHRPDVVLQFTIKPNIYGTLAAKCCGIPTVNNVSGLGTVFLNNQWSSKIARGLYRIAFRYPFRVFFQNDTDKQLFLDLGLLKESMVDTVPGSGVDLKKFDYHLHKRRDPFIFLMVARLIYDKGLREYLEACKLVKDQLGESVEFRLQGAPADSDKSGIVSTKLHVMLSRYPVRYFPFTDSIQEYVSNVDVVVLPSYREGTSRVLLESAAIGKPLIASDVPGCREIVRPGYNGWLCHSKDTESLKRAMLDAYHTNEQDMQRLSENGRLLVEQEFSVERVSHTYLNVVAEALQSKLNA